MRKRGILQFQFVTPDTVSFLRMHKPSKYADYLGDIRHTFLNKDELPMPLEIFFLFLTIVEDT
jgi:hypothetical protein